MKFKPTFNTVMDLHRHQPLTALLIWLYAILISGVGIMLFSTPDHGLQYNIFGFFVYTCFFGGVSFAFLATTLNGLVTRIRAGDQDPEWNVLINGVTVGQISDSAYASIRRDVLMDYRVYLEQLGNFVYMTMRFIGNFMLAIPAFLFWVIFACAIFTPQSIAQAVTALQKITPAMVSAGALSTLEILTILFFVCIGLLLMLGLPFGFVNRFDEAVAKSVRRAVGCSATGDIFLVRFDEPFRACAFALLKKSKTKAGQVAHP